VLWGSFWLLERRFSFLFEFVLEVRINPKSPLFVAIVSLPQRWRVTIGAGAWTTFPEGGASHCTWWVFALK